MLYVYEKPDTQSVIICVIFYVEKQISKLKFFYFSPFSLLNASSMT